jgi:hypothetical protein
MVTMMVYILSGEFLGLYDNNDGICFTGEFFGLYGNNDSIYFSGEFFGLYGNNDGIKENDLVSRNGEHIDINVSMINIHNQFGLTCKYIPMLCYVVCVCVCGVRSNL